MQILKLFSRNKKIVAITNTETNQSTIKAMDGLRDIQQNFFDLIKSNPVSNRIEIVARGKFKIDISGSDQPLVVKQTRDFFESVISFWTKNYMTVQGYLQEIPGRYIHVDQGQLLEAFRKYGLLFDGLLVSDQILLSASDCISDKLPRAISGPLWMSLMSAANYLANEDLFLPEDGKPQAFLVPALRCLDSGVEKHWQNGSQSIFIDFFSELYGRQFESYEECAEYPLRSELSEEDLEPDLLKRILYYRGASNLHGYAALFREAMRKEQGVELPEKLPAMSMAFLDVSGRISEFERFSSDAYRWSQTNSIPYPNDLELYKWWAVSSSKSGAKTLGLPYDDDSLFMFAAESKKLGFLQDIPVEAMLKTARTTSAQHLRQDLQLSDKMLRSMQLGAKEMDFESIASGILDAINRFDIESKNDIAKVNRDFAINITGVAFSLGLFFLSQIVPPLSVISLLGGGSVIGTLIAANKRKKILETIRNRPISALCTWNKMYNRQSN